MKNSTAKVSAIVCLTAVSIHEAHVAVDPEKWLPHVEIDVHNVFTNASIEYSVSGVTGTDGSINSVFIGK